MNTQHHTAPSWRRWLVLACPPLVAIVCALTLTLPALAAKVYHLPFPVSGTVTNPCNGEVVTISGNSQIILNVTSDGSGGLHVVFRGNFQGVSGVGDQGNTYRIPIQATTSFNTRVGQEETFTQISQFIAEGSAPNFFFHEDAHITVNPDGTVTVFFDTITTSCHG
jgi:hypothetical protein